MLLQSFLNMTIIESHTADDWYKVLLIFYEDKEVYNKLPKLTNCTYTM